MAKTKTSPKPKVLSAVKAAAKTVKKAKVIPKPKKSKKNTSALLRKVSAEIVDDHEEVPGRFAAETEDEFERPVLPKTVTKPTKKRSKLTPATVETKALTATDPIRAYLAEVRRYPVLSKEEELEVAKRYFDTKDPVAAQQLVTANLRFVVKVAAEYSKFGARLIDLIQEGNMGLMHAVRDYNPYKGVRVITYAVWWIRGYIQEYLLKQYSMVKIATTLNQKKLYYRLQKEKDALDALGVMPDMKTISDRMGIPVEEVEQMSSRLSGRDISLNQPLDDNSSASLMDLQTSTAVGVDDLLGAQEELSHLREKIGELRDSLSEREKIILEERVLADDPLTLQEIGEKYGITREAVRQMEVRLMKKIKEKYSED